MTIIDSLDPMVHQGVLITYPNTFQIKVLNHDYSKLLKVRGNDPNIERRYLEIRQDPELSQSLKEMYFDKREIFEQIDKELEKIAIILHKIYMKRYVWNKGMYLKLPKEDHIFLTKCHEWHITNRSENKVYLEKIKEFLKDVEYYYVYAIIRRLRKKFYNELLAPLLSPHLFSAIFTEE